MPLNPSLQKTRAHRVCDFHKVTLVGSACPGGWPQSCLTVECFSEHQTAPQIWWWMAFLAPGSGCVACCLVSCDTCVRKRCYIIIPGESESELWLWWWAVPLPGDFSRSLEGRKITTQLHTESRHQADSLYPASFFPFLLPLHLR